MGAESFSKWGETNARQKYYGKFLWFELATVTSQAFKYDVDNICQHVSVILCNVL